MQGLTLLLDNDSVELLAEHTRLTNQKAQVNEDINKITGNVDERKFNQLNLPVNYTADLNKLATQISDNNNEQQQITQQTTEANQQIATLQQRSKTLSIVLIVAVIVIVIVIAAL